MNESGLQPIDMKLDRALIAGMLVSYHSKRITALRLYLQNAFIVFNWELETVDHQKRR